MRPIRGFVTCFVVGFRFVETDVADSRRASRVRIVGSENVRGDAKTDKSAPHCSIGLRHRTRRASAFHWLKTLRVGTPRGSVGCFAEGSSTVEIEVFRSRSVSRMRISESKPLTGGGQIAVFMRAFGTESTQHPTRVRASEGKLRAECPDHARYHAGSARLTRGLSRAVSGSDCGDPRTPGHLESDRAIGSNTCCRSTRSGDRTT